MKKTRRACRTIAGLTLFTFSTYFYGVIVTKSMFDLAIILLSDIHTLNQTSLEKEHLCQILSLAQSKKDQCTILVEDNYKTTGQVLKKLTPDKIKGSLLLGLTQRIESLNNRIISAVSIERSQIVRQAFLDFSFGDDFTPPFYGISPKKLKEHNLINPYMYTFEDLFKDINQSQQELEGRRKSFVDCQNINLFINAMTERISTLDLELKKNLADSAIKITQSILSTAIHTWIARRIEKYPNRLQETQKLKFAFQQFKQLYLQGIDKSLWKKLYEDIASFKLQFFSLPNDSSLVQNNESAVMLQSTDESLTLNALESRKLFKKFADCLWKLRLTTIDSHAVLDIISSSKKSQVVLIAGDDHVKNIRFYLSQLGFKETGFIKHEGAGTNRFLTCADITF